MSKDDVQPPHCHARARRALGEIELVRREMGRDEDPRPLPEISGAAPREVYFEAIALWHKADRLALELGADSTMALAPSPPLTEIRPGHVLRLLDALLDRLTAAKIRLGVTEVVTEPPPEPAREPADVLRTLIHAGRNLSRALERPFAPADVYTRVALASAYAGRMLDARRLPAPSPARFERGLRPADCYRQLEGCLAQAASYARRQGHAALTTRGEPTDVVPGDVYDLATLVLGEVAFLHAITPGAAPVPAFEPVASGHRLPAHVHQAATTLELQLAILVE